MGQNNRYGSDPSRAAIADTVLKPTPTSLTELQIGGPVRQARRPIRVVVWVPFGIRQVELDGRAVAWTDRAMQVEVEMKSGAKHRAWVWA